MSFNGIKKFSNWARKPVATNPKIEVSSEFNFKFLKKINLNKINPLEITINKNKEKWIIILSILMFQIKQNHNVSHNTNYYSNIGFEKNNI